jgi:hypothetical protein
MVRKGADQSDPPADGRLATLMELFAALADLEPAERERRLAALARHQPEATAALRKMLRAESSEHARLLDHAPVDVAAALDESDAQIDAMPSAAPDVGSKYRVLGPLGFGSHGDVYLARQLRPVARDVAIKVLRPSQVRPTTIERMSREAQALATLDHAHIATVFETGQTDDGRPYIVTEHVPGEPIDRWCVSAAAPVEARCRAIAMVCRAVEHMHQRGIIHRDLKPTNILVHGPAQAPHPKILDLGIAKILGGNGQAMATLTRDGALLGSIGFIAPEQFRGAPADTRADIFAVGRILELVLEGVAWPPATARDLHAIVRQATADAPHERYQSAGALAGDLEAVLAGRPITARRQTPLEAVARLVRRHRPASAVVLASVLAVVLALGVAIERSAAQSRTLREQARTLEMQKQLLTDTLDGSVVVLGRYAGTIEQRSELAEQLEAQLEMLLAATERARITLARGQLDAARALASGAAATMRREIDPVTASERAVRQLGLAAVVHGDCLAALRAYDRAEREYAWALDLHLAARERFPKHVGLLDDLCWSLDRFSQPLDRGLPGDAASRVPYARWAQERLDLAHELLALDPSRYLSRFNLAVASLKLGKIHAGFDDASAEPLLEAACHALEALCREDPGRTAPHAHLSATWRELAELYERRADDASALDAFERSVASLIDAVSSQPNSDAALLLHLRRRATHLADRYAALGRTADHEALLAQLERVAPE